MASDEALPDWRVTASAGMKAVVRTENPSLSNIASVADWASPPAGAAGLAAPGLGAGSAGFAGSPVSGLVPSLWLNAGAGASGLAAGEAEGGAGG